MSSEHDERHLLQCLFERSYARVKRTGICQEGLNCRYRAPSGIVPGEIAACAIGALIPDQVYDPTMEGSFMNEVRPHDGAWGPAPIDNSPAGMSLARALNKAGIPATQGVFAFLVALQAAHDSVRPTSGAAALTARVLGNMRGVAKSYGLKTAEL